MYASIYASSHATQWNGTVIMAISIGNLFRSSSNVFVQNATDLSQWKLESREALYNVEFEMERGLVSDQFQ